MNGTYLLQKLRTSSEVKRILEYDFEFSPTPPSTTSSLFQFRNGTKFEIVGKDAAGGEFALCESRTIPTRPLLYVSSEGQAGVIGRSLESGLSMIVDLPYWHDCLKFSGSGQLAEMRRVIPFSESDLTAGASKIDASRQALRTLLNISPLPDSVQELHSTVTELSPLYLVCGPDGWPFQSLFNKFTVASNPLWRRKPELQ